MGSPLTDFGAFLIWAFIIGERGVISMDKSPSSANPILSIKFSCIEPIFGRYTQVSPLLMVVVTHKKTYQKMHVFWRYGVIL